VDVTVAAKGGGSENKSKMIMLNPSDNIVDWVLKTVPTMGAGWCPPGMLGIGIGGTAEKAVLLAKESLMEDLDMYELQQSCQRCSSTTWKSCAWSCSKRSTRWASAPKAWAA
jgi:fumarate hydratase class I